MRICWSNRSQKSGSESLEWLTLCFSFWSFSKALLIFFEARTPFLQTLKSSWHSTAMWPLRNTEQGLFFQVLASFPLIKRACKSQVPSLLQRYSKAFCKSLTPTHGSGASRVRTMAYSTECLQPNFSVQTKMYSCSKVYSWSKTFYTCSFGDM